MRWGAPQSPTHALSPSPLCQGENLLYCFEVAAAQPALTQGKQDTSHIGLPATPRGWVLPASRPPCLSPPPTATQCRTEGSTRGLAAVPRLALDVMACEVLRVLQLTDTALVPVSYVVPRKVRGAAGGTVSRVPGDISWVTPQQHRVTKETQVCRIQPGKSRRGGKTWVLCAESWVLMMGNGGWGCWVLYLGSSFAACKMLGACYLLGVIV